MMRAPGPLRVLAQIDDLGLGGTQINAVDLAAALRDHDVETVVVGPVSTIPRGPSLLDLAAARGVCVRPVDRPLRLPARARALGALADELAVDLVHVYGSWSVRPAYWGPCRLGRRPLVVTVYEMEVADVVYGGPPLIVGTGYLLDEQQHRHGPVRLVSPPVDLRSDAPSPDLGRQLVAAQCLDPHNLRVVIVSRLDDVDMRPVKSTAVEAAIEAIERMGRHDVDLLVVGGGSAAGRLAAMADAANDRLGRKACRMLGPMSDPRPAYAAADVVIGMGGSAARALSFGKPLIVSGEYGTFEALHRENAEALFRVSFWDERSTPRKAEELIRELRPLLDRPHIREERGRFGREFAESHFGLDRMAAELARIYRLDGPRYGPRAWAADSGLELRFLKESVSQRLSRLSVRGRRRPR